MFFTERLDRSISDGDLKRGVLVSRRYRNRRIGDFLKELEIVEGRNTGRRPSRKGSGLSMARKFEDVNTSSDDTSPLEGQKPRGLGCIDEFDAGRLSAAELRMATPTMPEILDCIHRLYTMWLLLPFFDVSAAPLIRYAQGDGSVLVLGLGVQPGSLTLVERGVRLFGGQQTAETAHLG